MKTVPLSAWVDELESGARPKGGIRDGVGEVPSLGAEHLADDGGFNFAKDKRIPHDFFRSMKKGRIKPEDILIVKDGATTGKVSFVNDDFPFEEAAINEHVFRLGVSPKKADPRFVFRYLQSPLGQQQIMSDFRGATVGGIGRTFLDKVFVPDVPLNEQRRIAAILGKADAVRRKREQALALADDFLRSVFLEMFGDPVINPKNFSVKPFSKLVTAIDSGFSPKCETRPATSGEFGVLKVSSVSSTQFRAEENKAVFPSFQPNPAHLVRKGDLLFSRKNTYELVGASALVESDADHLALPDLIFRLVVDPGAATKEFLWAMLVQPSMREQLRKIASGAAASMPNIGKGRLMDLEVMTPKLQLQQDFSAIYTQSRAILAKQTAQQADATNLLASLSQRAFRGEL